MIDLPQTVIDQIENGHEDAVHAYRKEVLNLYQRSYLNRRKEQGFHRVGYFIHEDDIPRAKKYIDRLRKEKLKAIEAKENEQA